MISLYLLLLSMGILGGLIAGFLGVGGGIIYILILPYAFHQLGMPPNEVVQFTIANSILGTLFSAIASNWNHWKNNEIYTRYIFQIGISGVIVSLASLFFFVNTPLYQKPMFDKVVVFLLLFMLISTLYRAKRKSYDGNEKPHALKLLTVGFFSGLVASLSGLGGGIIIIPFLNGFLKLNIKVAKTISLGVIMITSFAMVIYNLQDQPSSNYDVLHLGYIVPQAILPIILGTIMSSAFGVRLGRKVKAEYISYIFAIFISAVMVKKIMEILTY